MASSSPQPTPPERDRAVGAWLLASAGMVLAMAVIGAITRLTESGLSIMEWAPVRGVLPPLSREGWEHLFDLYKQTGEYRRVNRGMTLEQFRSIFWWEYVHRLWGRLIGVVFAVPLAVFALRRRIPRGLGPGLVGALLLGGLQGFVGWYMVSSGFSDRTDVSQYRLVIHLGLALVIYSWLLWLAMGQLLAPAPRPADPRVRRLLGPLAGLVFLTLLSGGFVAGLDAGRFYNTFPLMNGRLVPSDWGTLSPWWRNPFENPAAAQFDHRLLAELVAVLVLALWAAGRRRLEGVHRRALDLVALALAVQFALGVTTLLLAVPTALGALHQLGGILLLTALLHALHRARHAAG